VQEDPNSVPEGGAVRCAYPTGVML
jgi:hypothetical protein